jgi:hypothetical protein
MNLTTVVKTRVILITIFSNINSYNDCSNNSFNIIVTSVSEEKWQTTKMASDQKSLRSQNTVITTNSALALKIVKTNQ